MRKKNLADLAYNYLYESIITHKLAPGSAIVETEISQALGISRTPIREALKRLGSEGLVKHYPSRGTFVASISKEDIEEIFDLREALEVLALKNAASVITFEQLDKIEEQLNNLTSDSDKEDFYESDRAFHNLIINNCRNKRLVQFINNLNALIDVYRRLSALTPHRLNSSKKEHLAVVKALKEKNTAKAVRLLRKHFANVKKSTVEICKIYNSRL